jgi:hypothetical protein
VPAAVAADYAEALKYSQCMRAHGVPNFPDPNSAGLVLLGKGPNNASSQSIPEEPGYASANRVCGHLLPNGGTPTSAQLAYIGSQLLHYLRCIRSHGVPSFPDPTISSHLIGFKDVGRSLVNAAAFKSAQKPSAFLLNSAGGP